MYIWLKTYSKISLFNHDLQQYVNHALLLPFAHVQLESWLLKAQG